MAGVYHLFVYMQPAQKYGTFHIHPFFFYANACRFSHIRVRSAPLVVYTRTAVFWGSLHINKEMLYTSHFLNFLSPNPVVVCIYIYIYCDPTVVVCRLGTWEHAAGTFRASRNCAQERCLIALCLQSLKCTSTIYRKYLDNCNSLLIVIVFRVPNLV